MKLEQPKGPVLEGRLPRGEEESLRQEMKDAGPAVTGGVSEHFGDPVAMAEEGRVRAEALQAYGEAKSANATPEAKTPVKAEKPLDTSVLRNHIEQLKSEKPGFFKRLMGGNEDTIGLLKKALGKIEGDKGFAKHYMAALEHGEDFALEYAKDIGAGKFLKPVDGVLMTTDKRHANKFIG